MKATNGTNAVLTQFDVDVFSQRNITPLVPYRFGSYLIYEANNKTNQYYVSNFINLTSQDVTALYPAFMYEAILKVATGNPNF